MDDNCLTWNKPILVDPSIGVSLRYLVLAEHWYLWTSLPSITCCAHNLSFYSSQTWSNAAQICESLFSTVPLSFNFVQRTTFFRLSFQIIWPKNFSCHILIADRRCLFLPILLNTSSLEMWSIHRICSIHWQNNILVASSFFSMIP